MKVGTLAYATHQGLGVLAKSLHDAGIITDVFIVHHDKYDNHPEWYPNTPRAYQASARELTRTRAVRKFCLEMDVMFFLETPFDWSLIPFCRENGGKTVLMPMYECMPKTLPNQPDRFINPSKLDQRYYPDRSVFLPVGVSETWKLRERARTFVHNAGHGGLRGRNGTAELIEAIPLIKSPIDLIIRSQNPLGTVPALPNGRIFLSDNQTVDKKWLYDAGDVFLFPEKFNGLSLPLQEAFASGMMVMCLNRFPMNDWLPREPLIPVSDSVQSCVSPRCNTFNEAVADPWKIAETIDYWFNRDISAFSRLGQKWAQLNSWERLKPRYIEELAR